MYMVGVNEGKSVVNEIVKSMYMMVKHVHDMYMGRHALIVKKSCTSHVYVWLTCTCFERLDIQVVEYGITYPCTCLCEILKKKVRTHIKTPCNTCGFQEN